MVSVVKNFRHIGIVSSDISKSLSFYCDLLDFKIEKKSIEKPEFIKTILNLDYHVELETIKLSIDDQIYVELLNYDKCGDLNLKKINDLGITHFALTIYDSVVLHKKIIDGGYKVLSKPILNEEKTAKVFFAVAPDNVYIELVEIL